MSDVASTESRRAAPAADAPLALPAWAVVSEKRRSHIARVTALLEQWAAKMGMSPAEAAMWRDAGLLHDALRDADEPLLRRLSGVADGPAEVLHGPAAARLLSDEGESRGPLLDAIRYHTIGYNGWAPVGRALYMADFLEPGRKFLQTDRAFLAAQVPHDFDAVFRQVVRMRLEYGLREGMGLFPETVALWNAIR